MMKNWIKAAMFIAACIMTTAFIVDACNAPIWVAIIAGFSTGFMSSILALQLWPIKE